MDGAGVHLHPPVAGEVAGHVGTGGHRHVDHRTHRLEGGEGVVADALVTGPGISRRRPDTGHGTAAEPRDGVERGGHLQAGVAEPAPRARHARAHGHHDGVGVEQVAGHGEGTGHVEALVVTTEGMAGGDGAHQQTPVGEVGHRVAQREGQRPTIGHHVGHPDAGSGGSEGHGQHRQVAVEAGHHDRHPTEVGRQVGVVLLGCAGVDLETGVAQLHEVARPGGGPRSGGEVPVDHVPATGTEAQTDRGGVHHHPVAHGHRPRRLGDGVGALAGVEADAADARPFAEDLGHGGFVERRHQRVGGAGGRRRGARRRAVTGDTVVTARRSASRPGRRGP